jgi:phthalate 4,5-dioxygenase oxygenase subunit
MLSVADNELLTRVGPGTPMGNLMRQYWVPALLSSELPKPDCDPVRVMLLGEPLIAFRDSQGEVGLLADACPHRGASLFFGRNENCGLRCVYHGWKFDVRGNCVDMLSEPPETSFKDKVKAQAYPCQERGGVVWTYMGSRQVPPPLPNIEGNNLPESEAGPFAMQIECNYLQILEGDIDTVHAGILHFGAVDPATQPEGSFAQYTTMHRTPKYVATDSAGGTMYGAYRDAMSGYDYWRIAQFLFPFYTMTPTGLLGIPRRTNARVPMDDTHTMVFVMGPKLTPQQAAMPSARTPLLPNTTGWYGRFRPAKNLGNDFQIDRELQRRGEGPNGFTGIETIVSQDQAMTVSMGPIYDRSKEHLGTSDVMVIRTRRRLLEAVRALAERGIVPPGVDDPEVYAVRSGGVYLPKGVDWVEATKDLRKAFVVHPELDPSVTGARGGVAV